MIKDELMNKAERYRNIINLLEKSEVDAPNGTLRISVDGKRIRYYHCSKESDIGERYIDSGDMHIARALAQKKYNEKVLKLAHKRLDQIKKILKDYEEYELDSLYDKLHPARKNIVIPVEKTIRQKYEEWLNEKYQGKEFYENIPLILTEKGERVRSKSEKIMADHFHRNNIEYKYEKPLFLKGMGTVYPDFTIFSMKLGKEIYWEHNGKMDDPGYSRKAIRKIETYENNKIYLGESLIVTFETSEKILSTKEIDRVIERYII